MVKTRIYQNDVKLSLGQIESLELIGIFQDNWYSHQFKLYADPASIDHVYAVGTAAGSPVIVLSHNLLSAYADFRIALDYWKHDKKIYTRK